MNINELTTIIRSLSRTKNRTPEQASTLRAAQMDKAILLGITVDACDQDLLSDYAWNVAATGKVQAKKDGNTVGLGQLIMGRILNMSIKGVVTQTAAAENDLDYRRDSLVVAEKGTNYHNQLQEATTEDLPTEFRCIFLQDNGRWTARVVLSMKTARFVTFTDLKTSTEAHYATHCGYEAKAEYYAMLQEQGVTPFELPEKEVYSAMCGALARIQGACDPSEAESHFVAQKTLDAMNANGGGPRGLFTNVRQFTTDDASSWIVPAEMLAIIERNKIASDEAKARSEGRENDKAEVRYEDWKANNADIIDMLSIFDKK